MKKSLLALLIVAISPFTQASENSSDGKTHTVGFGAGVGDIKSDYASGSKDVDGYYRVYYNYKFDSTWSLNLEHVSGDTNAHAFAVINIFNFEQIEYDATIISAKGSHALSNRWNVYGKLGAHRYSVDYKSSFNSSNNTNDDGFGIAAAIGIDFRAYNGFGVGFEIQQIDMGDTRTTSHGMHVSYAF